VASCIARGSLLRRILVEFAVSKAATRGIFGSFLQVMPHAGGKDLQGEPGPGVAFLRGLGQVAHVAA